MSSIIRAPRSHNYDVLPRDVVRNTSLSYRARGVLQRLLSNADGYSMTIRDLAREAPEGRDAIASAVRELARAGYVVYERRQRPNGQWETITTVYDEPQPSPEKPSPGNPASGGPGSGESGRNRGSSRNSNSNKPPPPTPSAHASVGVGAGKKSGKSGGGGDENENPKPGLQAGSADRLPASESVTPSDQIEQIIVAERWRLRQIGRELSGNLADHIRERLRRASATERDLATLTDYQAAQAAHQRRRAAESQRVMTPDTRRPEVQAAMRQALDALPPGLRRRAHHD